MDFFKMTANLLIYGWAIFNLAVFCISFASAEPGAKELTIGVMTELSGSFAPNGVDMKNGYELARAMYAPGDRVGNYHLRFIFGDTKGEAKTGVSEFERLVTMEKAAVVVFNRSQVGMAINPISAQKKIPILGVVGSSEFVGRNPFAIRFWPTTDLEASVLAEKLIKLQTKRAALLSLEDDYLLSVSNNLRRDLKTRGVQIVFQETVTSDEANFSVLAAKIKDARPHAVFLALGIAGDGIMIRRLYELGLRVPVLTDYWGGKQEVIDTAGPAAIEGAISVGVNMQKPRFQAEFKRRHPDLDPSAGVYTSYTAMAALLQTLKRHPDISDPASMQKALEQETTVPLLDGSLKIVDRNAQYDMQLKVIRGGKVESLIE